ncbi:Fe(3+) ions import ATP-binding protein FbpC 2 [invertebrate metagenome]|uniref:Fe(3+) ions import ATP-binding protein FbpC 2 n=1 Tax=invertebrate metagenome TaxID=1711999 RepID=A0A2H9T677_9ZZZZ
MARFFLEDPIILRQPVSQLTHEEQYRVIAVRVLIGNPSVILLDEPLVSIIPAEEKQIFQQVLSECRSSGISLIYTNEMFSPYADKIINTQEFYSHEDIALS